MLCESRCVSGAVGSRARPSSLRFRREGKLELVIFGKLDGVTKELEPPIFTHRRRIEFADTDVGGIVHFSRFFVFMETAEHEMLRHLGTSVHQEHKGRVIGWPRVSTSCSYLKPARFGDEIAIEVRLERRGERSMTYVFRLLRGDELLAEGQMTSVCCALSAGQPPQPIRIPEAIGDKLPGGSG